MAVSETGTRARLPDERGFATTADGLRLHWERHGDGPTTIVLLPANPISHLRLWKAQLHYLARHFRVIAYDGRGNGESDHPEPDAEWLGSWYASDCLTVLDATGTGAAVLVGLCADGVWPSIQVAADHPARVLGVVAIAPGVPLLTPPHSFRAAALETYEDELDDPQGWEKMNRRYIRGDHRGFLEFFFGEMFPEPHSTKQIEDAVAYGLDGSLDALLADPHPVAATREEVEAICRRVRCPVLVVQGDRDNCQPFERGLALAGLTGAEHVRLAGAGHIPNARHPVLVNELIRDFAERFAQPSPRRRTWTPAQARPRRALFVSSPIGLGHAWRDVAVARELRALVPDLEVQWLAQEPLTTLLAACGETVHPMSVHLAPEARHVDAEAGEHELHAFQMLRRLDEIFCANFMVFLDLVRDEHFDLWIADEGWEIDYFLHENPELKTSPYVWLTDFVGVVPMASGGEREAFLAADHNEEMIEHVARFPWVRDRSIFIGERDDVVARPFGPGLPSIRDWTESHFDFAGYITGFDPAAFADRAALREQLGYRAGETVCIVTAGGSAVGGPLLRRVADALPALRDAVPNLRLVLVGGPRVETDLLRTHDGVEVLEYVHELYRHLAACDVAVSHGGLATTMELAALRRPFLYFPLRDHFEQNVHVRHRLERHGAGRYMDFDATGPAELAAAVAEELERDLDYAPVPVDGAARAARLVAELLEQPPVFRRTPPGSTRPWSLPTPVPSSSPSPAR